MQSLLIEPGLQKISRREKIGLLSVPAEFPDRLLRLPGKCRADKHGDIVKGIHLQVLPYPGKGFFLPSNLCKECRLETPGPDIVHISDKALFDKPKRLLIFSVPRSDHGKAVEAHLLLLARPGCLVEGVIRLLFPSLIEKRKAQVVERLRVIRVRDIHGKSPDGCPEVLLRLRKTAPPKEQKAVCIVDARIPRIAL